MPNKNDVSQLVDDKFEQLIGIIENSSETPSQKEMDAIVGLIDEISKLEEFLDKPDIENSGIKKKK